MARGIALKGIPLAERAYGYVKMKLMTGAHLPGDWIPVDEISSELGTSRQPVMDAMKRLSSEGFIDVVPQVGSRVRRHRKSEIADFYALFRAGEALIAEMAALRATSSQINRLRLISGQIQELFRLPSDDDERGELYRSLNRQMHGELRDMIQSPMLAEIVEGMGDMSDFFIAGAPKPVFSPGLVEAHAEHERIIDAIAHKEGKLAHAAMEAHIRGTERRLMMRLEDEEETAVAAQAG